MKRLQYMRKNDNVRPTLQPIKFAGLAGRWRSSDSHSRGVSRFELTVHNDIVKGRIFGASENGLIDWGIQPVLQLFSDGVSSPICAGFRLQYNLGFLNSHVQANFKLGVMVLGVHQSFIGRDGQHNYFFREFLAKSEHEKSLPINALLDRSCVNDEPLGASAAAIRTLIGSWTNTNQATTGIIGLELEAIGEQLSVRVLGVGNHGNIEWGDCLGEVFTCIEEDAVPSASVLAQYDFGFFDCELQIRQNKGILAVTTFNRFRDGSGRSNYVTRELFHRNRNPLN